MYEERCADTKLKSSKQTGITAESGAFEARHKQMLATMRRIGNEVAHSNMELHHEDGHSYVVTTESPTFDTIVQHVKHDQDLFDDTSASEGSVLEPTDFLFVPEPKKFRTYDDAHTSKSWFFCKKDTDVRHIELVSLIDRFFSLLTTARKKLRKRSVMK